MEAPAQGLQGSTKSTNGAMLAVCNTLCIFISMRNPLRRVTNCGKSSLYIGFTSSLWYIRKLLNFWTCITSSRNQCSYTRIRRMASSCSCAVIAFPISLKKHHYLHTRPELVYIPAPPNERTHKWGLSKFLEILLPELTTSMVVRIQKRPCSNL